VNRILRAGLAAAGLLAASASAPAEPALELRSPGTVTYEPGTGRWRLEGGALLRRGDLTLRAGRAEWLPADDEFRAEGGVLLAEPGRALSAGSLRLRAGGLFEALGVRAWLKDRPEDLSGCATGEEARGRGRNRLTFSGDRISGRRGHPAVVLEGARITLCDCGDGPPSWEVRARRADVIPGDRAILDWPVLYVTPRFLGIGRPVPILGSPWGYLPLADRQTGLLLPELRFDGNGLTAGLPVFVALSRSWDLTATPEWITGPSDSQVARASRGVRGPGLGLELRWAPAPGADGLLRLHAVHSTISAWPEGASRPPGGNRIWLAARHHQALSPDAALAADLGLAGDPYYVADFTGDVILRGAEYRRTALSAWSRGDEVLLAAEAHLLQPLAFLRAAPGDPVAPYGALGTGLSALHRLPALSATVLPWRLAGPLRAGGTVQLARFAPLRGSTGDEGRDGVGPGGRFWGLVEGSNLPPLGKDEGERDGRWQPGERLAATRALARAELAAPLTAWQALLAEPWVTATGAGYAFDAARPAQGAARVSGGLALSTELSRTFGAGSSRLLHVVAPRAEWRAGSRSLGPALPSGFAYDDQDAVAAPATAYRALPGTPTPGTASLQAPNRALSAAPVNAWQQLRLSVRSRLVAPAGPLPGASLDLELGQDLDLAAGRAAEAFAALSARMGPVTADVGARYHAFGASRPEGSPTPITPSWLDRFPELRASLTVGGPRADVHAAFQAWGPGGSQRLAAGPEPFFDPRPIGLDAAALGTVGFRARWSAAQLGYDLQFTGRTLPTPLVPDGRTGPHVLQQTARLTWDSPCRCFRLGVVAWLREGDRWPGATLTFDVGAGEARPARPGPLLDR